MPHHPIWSILLIFVLHVISAKDAATAFDGDDDSARKTDAAADEPAQALTVIAYASSAGPARHLVSFSKRFGLDLHLIGVGRPWGGFNDKITGFSRFIEGLENAQSSSIVLVLDAYDTVPICSADELLSKFNAFGADIVMSTGKDCWPDPNVEAFLLERLSDDERASRPFLPWFLCPNSGAIMGRHDAMLSMFRRVHQMVTAGNGSCADFEGNEFTKNTQSDQRCYTSYYTENVRFHEMEAAEGETEGVSEGVLDLSDLDGDAPPSLNKEFYDGIKMALDYDNALFLSTGGMMFMDIELDIGSEGAISMRSKVSNSSFCVLHGNGPGVILWRSFVKQMKHRGALFVDDYVLRVGSDLFHWMLWWVIMPCERLSHWMSVHFGFDLGFHSTTFTEEVIWNFHIGTFLAIVIAVAIPLGLWYRFRFRAKMKRRPRRKESGGGGDDFCPKKGRKKESGSEKKGRKKEHPLSAAISKGLGGLEIMVQHNGKSSTLALSLLGGRDKEC